VINHEGGSFSEELAKVPVAGEIACSVPLVICAVAVSGAVFIIMAHAYVSGVMKISSLALRDA
jgi:hypothetical protein